MSICCKPSCARAGTVVLAYDYAARRALLTDPAMGRPDPHVYMLCESCASRLSPPRGWTLEDLRSDPMLFGRSLATS